MSDESFISKHVVEKAHCSVRIKGSCGKSSSTEKGTLKFGILNAQGQVIPVALEVLLVRDLGASIVSVGALAEKGVKCNLLSTHPVLLHGANDFPISTEVPRMYVVNILCYESLERLIGISHTHWNHGKINGTKAPLSL